MGGMVRRRAVLWMLGAVFLWSWEPLGVAVMGPGVGPFLYLFWFQLAKCVVWLVVLVARYRVVLGSEGLVGVLGERFCSWDGVLSVLNGFYMCLFVWAAVFVNTAMVVVVTSCWLVLFCLRRERDDVSDRFVRLGGWGWLLLGVAVVGVGLVTLSQTGGVLVGVGFGWVWGLVIALVAVVVDSWMACRFKLGSGLCDRGFGGEETGWVLLVSLVSTVPSVVAGLVLGLWVGSAGGLWSVDAVLVFGLGVLTGVGGVGFFHANVVTRSLGVNVLTYFQSVLALGWLGLFSTVTVVRPDWLVLGAVGVVAANVLLGSRR